MRPSASRLRTAGLLVATIGATALALARVIPAPAEGAAPPPDTHAHHAATAPAALVHVTMREWRVASSARSIPAGRVTFAVRNAGTRPHEFKVVTARQGAVKAFAVRHDRAVLHGVKGGLRPLRPGETRRLTMTLARGRYVLLCNLVGHYRRATIPVLRVRARTGAGPGRAGGAPVAPGSRLRADTTLALSTSGLLAFDTAMFTAPEGRVTIVVTNKEVLPHNLAIRGNGVDVKGPEVGQGKTSSVSADLAPGAYTFYCSVPGHEGAGMKGRLVITRVSQAPGEPLPDTGGAPGTSDGSGGGTSPPASPPPPGALSLTVTGLFAFSTTRLEAAPDEVTIVLTNNSPLAHNIGIRGNGVDVRGAETGTGGQSTVTATLPEGTCTFFCSVPGHEVSGMAGTLAVTATGGGGSGPGGGDPPGLDGLTIFRGNCGGCHTLAAAATTGTVGPNLDDEEPSADKVVERVNEGDDPMPSFRGILTDVQIAAVAEFVASSTRGEID